MKTTLPNTTAKLRATALALAMLATLTLSAQTYDTQYRRPVSQVMADVAARFGVKFKFDANVDTTGINLP